jgi:hypothetical protein
VKRQFGSGNLVEWLGPDANRIWACSFTVDEHEGFGLVWRVLGGRAPKSGVRLSYHRGAFRRAGEGVMPRTWLNPVVVPSGPILPTYHPKLILAETADGHVLVVSTGNLATDDLWRTRNLGARFDISAPLAKQIASWIERHPEEHRSLCVVTDTKGREISEILPAGPNLSTLEQIVKRVDRCQRCRSSQIRAGEWIVAAPFWSPQAVARLLELEPDGSVEAYFRVRAIWDQLALAFRNDLAAIARVTAYELRKAGELPRCTTK